MSVQETIEKISFFKSQSVMSHIVIEKRRSEHIKYCKTSSEMIYLIL
jgi:hypothetical protein